MIDIFPKCDTIREMKGSPQTAAEWADALEEEAVKTILEEGGTVDDIREEHARLIEELFEGRAEINSHTPAIVASFRNDMMDALGRVEEMAKDREHKVTTDETSSDEVLVNKKNADDMEVGKFNAAPVATAA